MLKDYINIYQASRNSAGMTQERAAELLGVSVESIRDYEGGKRFPPNQVVARMIELYSSPYLAIQHINNSARELAEFLPKVSVAELPLAVLTLLNEINEFAENRNTLISITCDGVITSEERPAFDKILYQLEDIVSAAMSVRFAR